MKIFRFIPLLFLTACSTEPKLALRPQAPSPALDNSTVRYPEVVRAYHFGRYVDPNDNLIMHEQHTVFRVEENTRWNLHPGGDRSDTLFPGMSAPHDAAFFPMPVNDAVLAEVNAQRLATAKIMTESKTLGSALQKFESSLQNARKNEQATVSLRMALHDMNERLHALEISSEQPSMGQMATATNNMPADSMEP